MKFFFSLLISIGAITSLFSQSAPIKFGKLSVSDYNLEGQVVDTSASAVVLFDYGKGYFQFDERTGFNFFMDRTLRIKVLTKQGLDEANLSIPIYHSRSGDKELVQTMKAYTYNLEGKSLVKSKIRKDNMFIESTSERWNKVKVTMPDVKEGSVIEYQYTFNSPFIWNLPTWYFQKSIPVLHSEYYLALPEYLDYQLLSSGYLPYVTSEKSTKPGIIHYKSGVGSSMQMQNINYRNTQYHWIVENAPAFKPEAYISASRNYITKMEFELRGTKNFQNAYKAYMGSWSDLTKTYLEDDNFGKAMEKSSFLKNVMPAVTAGTSSDEEKIARITTFILKKVEWDGHYNDFASKPLKKIFDEGRGNSADINLLLIAALRISGISADPVLVSTRSHGLIRKDFAISKQFNDVIALAYFGDNKQVLLDATDRYVPVGVLPVPCLNGTGRVVSKQRGRWVPLKPTTKSENLVQTSMVLAPSGELSGKIKFVSKGYASYKSRKSKLINGEEKYIENVKEHNKDWTIANYSFAEDEGPTKPFTREYELASLDGTNMAGDLIMFNPMFGQQLKKNPFKLEQREYPVDFAYPEKTTYMLVLKIPEGYEVDELPKSTAVALPDRNGKFSFSVNQQGNMLNIVSIYEINKPMFSQLEYPSLKQFFQIIVNKQAEQVVLKRRTE